MKKCKGRVRGKRRLNTEEALFEALENAVDDMYYDVDEVVDNIATARQALKDAEENSENLHIEYQRIEGLMRRYANAVCKRTDKEVKHTTSASSVRGRKCSRGRAIFRKR